MNETTDKLTRIALLTQKIKALDEERKVVLDELRTLQSQGKKEEIRINQSGEYFHLLIKEHLQKYPKASKLQLAQKLKISQGRLYDLINGKRAISENILNRLSEIMLLSQEEKQKLAELTLIDRINRKNAKNEISISE